MTCLPFDNQTPVFYLAIRQRSEDLKHLIPVSGAPRDTGLAVIGQTSSEFCCKNKNFKFSQEIFACKILKLNFNNFIAYWKLNQAFTFKDHALTLMLPCLPRPETWTVQQMYKTMSVYREMLIFQMKTFIQGECKTRPALIKLKTCELDFQPNWSNCNVIKFVFTQEKGRHVVCHWFLQYILL